MNDLITRIESRLDENKTSVKTYKTFNAASKVGEKLGSQFAASHGIDYPVDYITVYLPKRDAFTVVFQQMAWMNQYHVGGYVGWFAIKGFFTI